MKRAHHYSIGRAGITQQIKDQTLLIPNQPIEPEVRRSIEPIKLDRYELPEKKKRSKYQRE